MSRPKPRRAERNAGVALFLPAAAALTIAAGLTFVAVQQDLRIGANDEPQQLAEDGARALDGGADPAAVVGVGPVPIDSSLAPFVAVFDRQGALMATNGSLDPDRRSHPSASCRRHRRRAATRSRGSRGRACEWRWSHCHGTAGRSRPDSRSG